MSKISEEYLAKARKLNKTEAERLLSRMSGKLPRRLEKDKLTREEAMALQLELEDEQLLEWRKVMAEVKSKEEAKRKKKMMAEEKSKAPEKSKADEKTKTAKSGKASAKVAEDKHAEK